MTCDPTTVPAPDEVDIPSLKTDTEKSEIGGLRPDGQGQYAPAFQRRRHSTISDPHMTRSPRRHQRGRRRRRARRWLGRRSCRLPLAEGRCDELPNHRAGRRFRWRVVLESIPWPVLRQRLVLLPSAAGGNAVLSLEEVRRRPSRFASTARASHEDSSCTRARCFTLASTRCDGMSRSTVACHNGSRR